jgi:hypothetical protein
MRSLLRFLILAVILTVSILVFDIPTKWGCALAVLLGLVGEELLKLIKILK